MRRTSFLLLSMTMAGGLMTQKVQPPTTHLKVGDMAPEFTLQASTGGQISLSDFRGKNTVVVGFFPAAFTGG